MKRLLSLALFGVLAAASVAAQNTPSPLGPVTPGTGLRAGDIGRTNSPPVTNPEPFTLVALAGGAAVAGGLLRRRKRAG